MRLLFNVSQKWGSVQHEVFMGYTRDIRGVFMGYTYVSGMCRVCIGYVSGICRRRRGGRNMCKPFSGRDNGEGGIRGGRGEYIYSSDKKY